MPKLSPKRMKCSVCIAFTEGKKGFPQLQVAMNRDCQPRFFDPLYGGVGFEAAGRER